MVIPEFFTFSNVLAVFSAIVGLFAINVAKKSNRLAFRVEWQEASEMLARIHNELDEYRSGFAKFSERPKAGAMLGLRTLLGDQMEEEFSFILRRSKYWGQEDLAAHLREAAIEFQQWSKLFDMSDDESSNLTIVQVQLRRADAHRTSMRASIGRALENLDHLLYKSTR